MTFLKKLAFIFTCALGMQFICQAYDAVGLKTEVAQILDFIKELDKQHSAEICTVAGWLDTNIAAEYNSILNNLDIITIAKTATANITLDAKLTVISQIMVTKAEEAQRAAEQNVVWEKENAKQQLEWAEHQAKRAKKAAKSQEEYLRAYNRHEEKRWMRYTDKLKKWGHDNFNRGQILGGCAVLCGFMIGEMLGRAIQYHDTFLLEKMAEMIAEAADKQHSKQTVKK